MAKTGHFSGMYLGDPEIGYVKLAESRSVSEVNVSIVSDLKKALKRDVAATRAEKSFLIEVLID